MKYISTKKGMLIFLGFDLALLLILFVALLPFIRQKQAPDTQDSALLNPKYTSQVHSITLSMQDNSVDLFHRHKITLLNCEGTWVGSDSTNDSLIWPADNQSVQNLIALASTVTTMYKRSDRVTSWKDFDLEESDAFCLTFYGEADSVLSQLYFGREDTLTQRIALRTSSRGTVWDIPSDIMTYLTLNQSFWADPYIYPRLVTGLSDAESSSLLRRGLIQNALCQGNADTTLSKDFGDGSGLRLSLFKQDDGSYLVNAVCVPGLADSEFRARTVRAVNYSYAISAWTYEHLMEE